MKWVQEVLDNLIELDEKFTENFSYLLSEDSEQKNGYRVADVGAFLSDVFEESFWPSDNYKNYRYHLENGNTETGLTVVQVEMVGGYEGAGEETYAVYRVTQDGVESYWRANGYYMSYDGTTWEENLIEVKPKEVTIIEYVPVEKD